MSQYTCPGCDRPMQRRTYERKNLGDIELDLCFTCQGIWFDKYESAQLTPGAVIQLFGHIHDQPVAERQVLADSLKCPHCRGLLALTHDMQRTNRISYYRCVREHGRFTPFAQFLREKNFVRSLSGAEIEQLKATMAQVRCSSCAAPLDLGRDPACPYCRSPLSILDADAVRKALEDLGEAERKRKEVNPKLVVEAMLAREPGAGRSAGARHTSVATAPIEASSLVLTDLVIDAIGALFE